MLLPTKLIPSCSLFSHWVVSDSSPPHELQHARLSCLSLSTGVCLNFCPLSWWHHPAISSSVAPFSSFPQSFPASGSFAVSQLCIIRCPKYWSFRFSIIPSNEYSWLIAFRMDWIELTAVQEALKSLLSPVPQFERINSSVLRLLYGPTLMSIHDYWKNHSFDYVDLCWQVMSLLFNMLSRFVIAFLPRRKHLLISWLQSLSAVILEPRKIKSITVSTFPPSICHEVMGLDAQILVFWMLDFKSAFPCSPFTLIKKLFCSSLLSAIRMISSAYLRLLIFLWAILIPACDSSSLAFHMVYSA